MPGSGESAPPSRSIDRLLIEAYREYRTENLRLGAAVVTPPSGRVSHKVGNGPLNIERLSDGPRRPLCERLDAGTCVWRGADRRTVSPPPGLPGAARGSPGEAGRRPGTSPGPGPGPHLRRGSRRWTRSAFIARSAVISLPVGKFPLPASSPAIYRVLREIATVVCPGGHRCMRRLARCQIWSVVGTTGRMRDHNELPGLGRRE